MAIPAAALELENRSIGPQGQPTLGEAYELLRDQWLSGDRDRELALHLMFLAWYVQIEPPHLTGFVEDRTGTDKTAIIFTQAHDWLLPGHEDADDAEALYVVGLMARLAPWILGDDKEWTARSEQYRVRYRALAPDGISPDVFRDRGAYGDYFHHQALVVGGY